LDRAIFAILEVEADSRSFSGVPPPPQQLATWLLLGAVLTLLIGLISLPTQHQPDSSRAYPSRPQIADADPVLLPQASTNEEYFLCGVWGIGALILTPMSKVALAVTPDHTRFRST